METNIAAWMIAGGPRIELQATQRDREQLHALRASRHDTDEPGFIARIIRAIQPGRPAPAACDPATCAA